MSRCTTASRSAAPPGTRAGAGAKILGPISIGERVRIGANSVDVKDVPAERTVVGVPGHIVDTRNGGDYEANGINLDHHLLPDPVAKSIACLIERIEMLEQELAELRHDPQPAGHSGQCRTRSAGDLCCEHESMHTEINRNAAVKGETGIRHGFA